MEPERNPEFLHDGPLPKMKEPEKEPGISTVEISIRCRSTSTDSAVPRAVRRLIISPSGVRSSVTRGFSICVEELSSSDLLRWDCNDGALSPHRVFIVL